MEKFTFSVTAVLFILHKVSFVYQWLGQGITKEIFGPKKISLENKKAGKLTFCKSFGDIHSISAWNWNVLVLGRAAFWHLEDTVDSTLIQAGFSQNMFTSPSFRGKEQKHHCESIIALQLCSHIQIVCV